MSPAGRAGGTSSSPGKGTSGNSGARVGLASSAGGSPTCTSRERRGSKVVAAVAVGGLAGGPATGADGPVWAKPLPKGREAKLGVSPGATGAGLPVPGARAPVGVAKGSRGASPGAGAAGCVVRSEGGRPPNAGGRGAAGGVDTAGVAKGQVSLGLVARGGAVAGGCAASAPARMRSRGLGCQGTASAGLAAEGLLAGGVPGSVKWRAAPG